jgi:NADH:ubiquinone oxidoreductase subunit F (NADH-binding)/NADH:ubiquinone oxidoreductase subunit E
MGYRRLYSHFADGLYLMLVQELYRIQNRLGWLPDHELRALAQRSRVPLYRLEEISSFFPHFRRQLPPAVEVKICRDMSCHLRGSNQLITNLQQRLGQKSSVKSASPASVSSSSPLVGDSLGEKDARQISVTGCSCLGRCDRAIAMLVEVHHQAAHHESATNGHHATNHSAAASQYSDHRELVYCNQTAKSATETIEKILNGQLPPSQADSSFPRHATNPWEIDVYADQPSENRYQAVRWYFSQSGEQRGATGSASAVPLDEPSRAKQVLAALETAGLLGMGGAGGRTYKKWQEVRDAKVKPKYVVCNGDESEPGTFKDREILLRTPHLVVEGVIMGGLVVGAERGIIYIRHEFHEQIVAVRRAIEEAEQLEVCGPSILGTGRSFKVEVFTSPGGYICGEQTALIEAIEDKRAEPRNRPPELQTNGLFDKPTLLNNVETLAWVPAILLRSGPVKSKAGDTADQLGGWYAAAGVSGYKGRRFFSISGDLNRPGAYEVPVGITLRELIYDYCGGTLDNRPIKALALSGPSGGLLPQIIPMESLGRRFAEKAGLKPGDKFDLLDTKLDIATARDMNVMLGGGMVVYAEGANILDEALSCLSFFRNESCGKCVPCRIGSQKLVEMATDLKAGRLGSVALPVLQTTVAQLAETMKLTAICGLGTVASNPMTTLLTHFKSDLNSDS